METFLDEYETWLTTSTKGEDNTEFHEEEEEQKEKSCESNLKPNLSNIPKEKNKDCCVIENNSEQIFNYLCMDIENNFKDFDTVEDIEKTNHKNSTDANNFIEIEVVTEHKENFQSLLSKKS